MRFELIPATKQKESVIILTHYVNNYNIISINLLFHFLELKTLTSFTVHGVNRAVTLDGVQLGRVGSCCGQDNSLWGCLQKLLMKLKTDNN